MILTSEIKKLIDHLPIKRDMLIEYLHLIQDKYNQIRKDIYRTFYYLKDTYGGSF